MLGTLGSAALYSGGAYLLTRASLVHLGFDAMLISAFLAGVKRTTGLTYVYVFLMACFPDSDLHLVLHYLKFPTKISVVRIGLLARIFAVHRPAFRIPP